MQSPFLICAMAMSGLDAALTTLSLFAFVQSGQALTNSALRNIKLQWFTASFTAGVVGVLLVFLRTGWTHSILLTLAPLPCVLFGAIAGLAFGKYER